MHVPEYVSKPLTEPSAALKGGVWQSDGSQHVIGSQKTGADDSRFTVTSKARNGLPTLRMAYFISGVDRKSSIGNSLKTLSEAEGYGLEVEEVDILRKGQNHDLIDKETQENYMADIESALYDGQFLSPPWGSWSRANFADDKPPQPWRNRDHPWDFLNQVLHQQKWAVKGNVFIYFSLRALAAA